jgi:DNA repair protein SbcD/Mre11
VAVRVLHVSDLHLGRSLGDLSREPEQRALVGELTTLARELDVALTVIAGDVFDAFTPPAWADDLFFELLDGLAMGGRRAVAVIGGNHDSGVRLSAADPLARRLGIVLAGDPNDTLQGHDGGGSEVRVTPLAAQVARIEVPGAGAPIVVGLMPFLSEARVAREADSRDLADGAADTARYARRLSSELAARAAHRERGAAHLLVMHQYVTGGVSSDSERRLRVGALADIDGSALPAGLDYVALGHLHRPQPVPFAPSIAVYAGSPIAYSFSEVGQEKRAVLVDIEPGRAVRLSDVPLSSGRPLEIWRVASAEEALDLAAACAGRRPIVELRADFGRRLSQAESDAFFTLENASIVAVRDAFELTEAELARAPDEPPELRVEELFSDLWVRRHGSQPDAETLRELASAVLAITGAETAPAGQDEA